MAFPIRASTNQSTSRNRRFGEADGISPQVGVANGNGPKRFGVPTRDTHCWTGRGRLAEGRVVTPGSGRTPGSCLACRRFGEHAHFIGQGPALGRAPVPHGHASAGLNESRIALEGRRRAQGDLEAHEVRRLISDRDPLACSELSIRSASDASTFSRLWAGLAFSR
jgi:hypothetical protein